MMRRRGFYHQYDDSANNAGRINPRQELILTLVGDKRALIGYNLIATDFINSKVSEKAVRCGSIFCKHPLGLAFRRRSCSRSFAASASCATSGLTLGGD
jgi:hypothetical protein